MVTNLQAPTDPQADPSLRTLIDELIAEQGQLQTPVARFADQHEREPDLAGHYRNLIPLSKPGKNEQYAFEVSLDRCTGCKACVSACHNLNGLDDEEVWRDTGTLLGGDEAPAWQQTVTTACHHCESPECMHGCPVGAYEKEPDTGIVRHLDDQCIGCSYCILKCPFDVPKYSEKRGIVRKCDMCHQRLAGGEAPACVQACPTEAIRIVKVPTNIPAISERRQQEHARNLFQSEAPNPQAALPASRITFPTTRYIGREVPQTVMAADRDQLTPEHAHWPLVFMLVFTQAGIGLCGGAFVSSNPTTIILGALLFNLGMVAAVFHLGQPLKAWRFFLGLKTSWLSREILAFSLFAPIPVMLCALPFLPDFPFKEPITRLAQLSVVPVGLVAVFTSVMIYADTKRALWSIPLAAPRFFGTVLAFLLLGLSIDFPLLRPVAVMAIATKGLVEIYIAQMANQNGPWTPLRHSAKLMLEPLGEVTFQRLTFSVLAMAVALFSPWFALPLLLVGEILERQLFFQSVHAPKMPGNFGPANGNH